MIITHMPTSQTTFRQKVADILGDESKRPLSHLINFVIIVTIIVTVVVIILESVPELEAQYGKLFYTIEIFSLILFSVEYAFRLWSAPDNKHYTGQKETKARIKYAVSPMAIIDLLAILPLILSLLSVDLRFLRVIRLLRIFKLTRYNSAMNMLLKVIKNEARAFFSVVFVLVIILILASSGIYLLEHKVQPEVFGSIPQSMWWSMVTLATVGYGDAVPLTTMGKLFGGVVMLVGIGIVALPAGILASAFSEQLHQNKNSYRNAVREALRDGIISSEEYSVLKELQDKYDLSPEESEAIIQSQFHDMAASQRKHNCPHCGHNLSEPPSEDDKKIK